MTGKICFKVFCLERWAKELREDAPIVIELFFMVVPPQYIMSLENNHFSLLSGLGTAKW